MYRVFNGPRTNETNETSEVVGTSYRGLYISKAKAPTKKLSSGRATRRDAKGLPFAHHYHLLQPTAYKPKFTDISSLSAPSAPSDDASMTWLVCLFVRLCSSNTIDRTSYSFPPADPGSLGPWVPGYLGIHQPASERGSLKTRTETIFPHGFLAVVVDERTHVHTTYGIRRTVLGTLPRSKPNPADRLYSSP